MREKGERKGGEGEGRSEEGEGKSVRCVHHNQTNWSALMLGTRRIMPTNCVSHRKLTCLLLLQAGGGDREGVKLLVHPHLGMDQLEAGCDGAW